MSDQRIDAASRRGGHQPGAVDCHVDSFLRELRRTFWREATWQARAALEFISESCGRLTTLRPDQLGWLRRDLLAIKNSDDFLWVLRWLRQEKHCNPALYADLIRTPSMKKKMEAVNAGAGLPRVR